MKLDWVPAHTDGLYWKAFAPGALPGSMCKGHVKKVGPKHYVAMTRQGTMCSDLTMHAVATWLAEFSQ